MSQIDWSKAPPHATHWCPGNAKIDPGWIYNPGGNKGEFYTCYAGKGLEHIPSFPEWRKARLIPRPSDAPWSGQGMPPVGLEVECTYPAWGYWLKGRVLCYGQKMIFMEQESSKGDGKFEGSMNPDGIRFRPFRTPEKIEEEERSEFASTLIKDLKIGLANEYNAYYEIGEKLYRLGYRKQEAS